MATPRILARVDWALVAGAAFLVVLGVLSITSTSSQTSTRPFSQIVVAVAGFALLIFVAASEYRTLSSYAPLLYGAGLLSLVTVLLFGVTRNGAQSWFDLGIMTIQPSEPMKLIVIVLLASSFARRARHSLRDVWRSSWILIPVLVLILRQPDVGTALTFIALWAVMLLGLNLRRRDLLMLAGGAALVIGLLLGAVYALSPEGNYRVQRLEVYPDHLFLRNVRHAEYGYQVDQALIAIGANGTLFGSGLGKGTQTHLGFLPAAQTDFIFAAITEELGFFGALLVLALYALVLWRLLRTAGDSIDAFGSYICLGLFGLLLFHLIENVGMNVGLLPVTGVPLLLVSQGGSHILTTLVGLGIAESIAIRSQKIKV